MANRGFKGFLSVFCLSLAVAACGEASKRTSQPLCPKCVAGGESTDFGGEVSCTSTNLMAIERHSNLAREFGVDEIIEWLEQPKDTSFGWRRQMGGSAVTGYQRETTVHLEIEVLGLSHAERVAISGPDVQCGDDFLLLDSRVRLATADQALSGTFERPIRVERNAATAYLGALGVEDSSSAIDLREFVGALDLGLADERGHSGTVALSLSLGPDAMRGSMEIVLQYLDEHGEKDALISPIRGQWPSDGCEVGTRRVDAENAVNPADGRSPRDYFDQMVLSLSESFPVGAQWLDGAQTEIELELGELDVACQNIGTPESYYLAAPLVVRSADGRLVTTQQAQVHFRSDVEADELYLVRSESMARDDFLGRVAVPDMDWASDFEASFELLSRRSSDGQPQGDLQVLGYDGERHNRLYLYWCSGSDCEGFPRPKE